MTHQPDLPEELMFPPGMLPPVPEVYDTRLVNTPPAPLATGPRVPVGVASPVILRFAGQSFTDLDLGPRAVRLPLDGEYVREQLHEDTEIEVQDASGVAHPGLAPSGSQVYFRISGVGCARWEPSAHTTGSWLFLATVNSRLLWISQLDGPDADGQFIWQAHNELLASARPAR